MFGVDGDDAHGADERVEIESLQTVTETLERAIRGYVDSS